MWDNEGIWNVCFGPDETPSSVLRECDSQGITPQAFASACVYDALEVMTGDQFDYTDAFYSLCKQLGVNPS